MKKIRRQHTTRMKTRILAISEFTHTQTKGVTNVNLEKAMQIHTMLRKGASYNIVYTTDCVDVNGNHVTKHVRRAVRLCVSYAKLKQNLNKQVGSLPGNGKWLIPNFIYQDNYGLKMRITNGAFSKIDVRYYDDAGHDVNPSDVKRRSSGYAPIVQSIKLDNVISIERKGEAL